MTRFLAIGVLICVLSLGTQIRGQHDHGDHSDSGHVDKADVAHEPLLDPMTGKVTMEGEIICISCHLRHAGTGEQHVKCALFCADKGMPFGFLEKESKMVYLLLPLGHQSPLEGLQEHIGLKVTVTGSLTHGRGLTGLQIQSVENL
jgi:hypothetical protein